MKITHFLWFLLIFSFFVLFFMEPKKFAAAAKKETAELIFDSFTIFEVTTEGILHILQGQRGTKSGALYEIDGILLQKQKGKTHETLGADKGRYEEKGITLEGNVSYEKNGTSFKTSRLFYNTSSEVLEAKESFEAIFGKNRVYGDSLIYDRKEGKMSARNIKAYVQIQ